MTQEPVPPRGTLDRILLRTEQTGWAVVYTDGAVTLFLRQGMYTRGPPRLQSRVLHHLRPTGGPPMSDPNPGASPLNSAACSAPSSSTPDSSSATSCPSMARRVVAQDAARPATGSSPRWSPLPPSSPRSSATTTPAAPPSPACSPGAPPRGCRRARPTPAATARRGSGSPSRSCPGWSRDSSLPGCASGWRGPCRRASGRVRGRSPCARRRSACRCGSRPGESAGPCHSSHGSRGWLMGPNGSGRIY